MSLRSRLRRFVSRCSGAVARRVRAWYGADHRAYERGVSARRTRYHLPPSEGQFSLLTTVYAGTPPEFFEETIESVREQSLQGFEWIILGHGELSPELNRLLDLVDADVRVRVIRRETNLGIIGGMRVCLEAATGEYVIPLDSDDLLTPDALQLVQHSLAQHANPAFVYTDEALLIDGRVQAPFRRPAWDPILNSDCSYVWHLTAFRRELALKLGLYTDAGCEYCHDWDTITRFAAAGQTPVHIPEVAYLWRKHAASHTNRVRSSTADPMATDSPAVASQKALLERERQRLSRPELFEIELFPVNRGAPEYHVSRKRVAPGSMTLVHLMPPSGPKRTLGADLLRFVHATGYPFQSVLLVGAAADPGPLREEIGRALDELSDQFGLPRKDRPRVHSLTTGSDFAGFMKYDFDTEYVAVCSAGYVPEGDRWPWEALKLFERFPQVPLIAGRLLDSDGFVLSGGAAFSSDGEIVIPGRGLGRSDPGDYGLALKPCSVALVDDRFWIGREAFFRKLWSEQPPAAQPAVSHLWPIASEHHIVSAILREMAGPGDLRIASTPLISARWRG